MWCSHCHVVLVCWVAAEHCIVRVFAAAATHLVLITIREAVSTIYTRMGRSADGRHTDTIFLGTYAIRCTLGITLQHAMLSIPSFADVRMSIASRRTDRRACPSRSEHAMPLDNDIDNPTGNPGRIRVRCNRKSGRDRVAYKDEVVARKYGHGRRAVPQPRPCLMIRFDVAEKPAQEWVTEARHGQPRGRVVVQAFEFGRQCGVVASGHSGVNWNDKMRVTRSVIDDHDRRHSAGREGVKQDRRGSRQVVPGVEGDKASRTISKPDRT